nr:M23 family metallopeptidase [Knoellia sp. DB2414S]
MHQGDDYAAPVGTRLSAMSGGVVMSAGPAGAYGNKVEIRYGDGTVSVYAHMDSVAVGVGDHVSAGQLVGRTGNTGRSTGPHLHLEIHPGGGPAVDPSAWLSAKGIQA